MHAAAMSPHHQPRRRDREVDRLFDKIARAGRRFRGSEGDALRGSAAARDREAQICSSMLFGTRQGALGGCLSRPSRKRPASRGAGTSCVHAPGALRRGSGGAQ